MLSSYILYGLLDITCNGIDLASTLSASQQSRKLPDAVTAMCVHGKIQNVSEGYLLIVIFMRNIACIPVIHQTNFHYDGYLIF